MTQPSHETGKLRLRERAAAGVVLAIGLLLAVQGLRMPLGTMTSFGPGLFPAMIGAALVAVAAMLVLFPQAGSDGEGDEPPPLRAMICVGLGMLAFALLVRTAGLVPAALALGMLASLGDPQFDPLTAVIVSVALAVTGVVIFIWALSMPLPIFRW